MLNKFSGITFFVLCVFLLITQFPAFNPLYTTSHDTSQAFEIFYFFYNHLFFTGKIPQWMPYYAQGIPSNYWQLVALTPFSYFLMFIGFIFRTTDVLLLFKISLFLEQLAFLMGMYVLTRNLFKSRATIFIVCLGAMASINWAGQAYFNLRMYYLLPWVITSLILFLRKKDTMFFWISGVIFLAWGMGNAPYFMFLWLWVLFFFFGTHWVQHQSSFSIFLKNSPWSKAMSMVLVFLTGSFIFYMRDILSFVDLTQRQHGGINSLGIFLTFGGKFETFQSLLQELVGGNLPEFYVGLVPLVFFVWALLKVRDKGFYPFLTACLMVIWLSSGGIFAAANYFFPGMAYYRHIGFVYGITKMFLLVCAGFGLEHFWPSTAKEKIWYLAVIIAIFIFMFDLTGLAWPVLNAYSLSHHALKEVLGEINLKSCYFRLGAVLGTLVWAVILASIAARRNKLENNVILKSVFVVIAVVDVSSFCFSNQFRFVLSPNYDKTIFQVHRPVYQNQMTLDPQEKRARDVLSTLTSGVKYATVYSIAQFEPCVATYRIDMRPKSYERWREMEGDKDLGLSNCDKPRLYMTEGQGDINVTAFDADQISFNVVVPKGGAILVYADNFHPGWKAEINGKNIPVEPSNGAYKSIFVPGPGHVHIYFDHGWVGALSYVFMAFGIVFTLILGKIFLSLFLVRSSHQA